MLNVAMLSKWHVHAEGYANDVIGTGKAKITVIWDDNEERGKEWAEKLGCDYSSCIDEVLARTDVDAVICDAPTTAHKDVIIKAAKAKKHIFTEKALCPTVADCEEVKAAVVESGVTFLISLPQRTTKAIQLAKQMIANGDFGKISLARIRNGHDGVSGKWLPDYWFLEKDTAGGSLMDLGCHPMYTACYLFGKPIRMASLMTAPFGSKVDEHASATIEFENGVLCTGETSFVTFNTPGAVEIYGSDATLLAYGPDIKIKTRETVKFTNDYVTPILPDALPMPIIAFIDACVNGTGTPDGFGIDDAIDLTRLLENAYVSNNTNSIVSL